MSTGSVLSVVKPVASEHLIIIMSWQVEIMVDLQEALR
jgi:hypothetical protein